MNPKVFKITGRILMLIGIIIPLFAIFGQLRFILEGDWEEGVISSVFYFVFAFLPGLRIYKISRKKKYQI